MTDPERQAAEQLCEKCKDTGVVRLPVHGDDSGKLVATWCTCERLLAETDDD